jgi:release factor glutamine methyltransferase
VTLTVRQALAQSGLVPIDAQVLLAHVCEQSRTWLAAHSTDALPSAAADAFFALAKRRRDGEPVAYLTGTREFWGQPLEVTPAVLIPRPETESLVEWALARIAPDRDAEVLDLGTGSGAVALAIARERPRARVLATDRSQAALEVATRNAQRLGLANVATCGSDWYAGLPPGVFDVIVSNPPYVAAGDVHLREGDLRFEPAEALVSGADGLDALRLIVGGARGRLAPGGFLAVEHGYDQADAVRRLLADAGLVDIHAVRDLAGIARVAGGRSS